MFFVTKTHLDSNKTFSQYLECLFETLCRVRDTQIPVRRKITGWEIEVIAQYNLVVEH